MPKNTLSLKKSPCLAIDNHFSTLLHFLGHTLPKALAAIRHFLPGLKISYPNGEKKIEPDIGLYINSGS